MEKFTRYTESWARPAATETTITFNQWSGEHEPPSHSLPTSMAGKLAGEYGDEPFHTFHFGLMEAYFTDNRTVSEPAVIVEVAEASGIDGDDFRRRLGTESERLARAVIDDHNDAVNNGIGGVPAVVVNDAFPVTGAQELDFYQRLVEKLSEQ